MPVKVSVIVPVYNPGERILRVIHSLDRQTLPADEFEAVFIDDGSTDGTGERLDRLAAQRPNMRVTHVPNSGWPSRPRNLGIDLACGDYVLFMDHDDELGDDALRRAYDFAVRHGSDVVVGKEVAVGRSALDSEMWRRNIARASIVEDRLLELLTAHRLLRREFLLTHDIRFPERIGLLEDNPFALKSYLRADVVSVLADYPVYRWIVEAENNSRRLLSTESYLANICECLDLVEAHTSPGPERDTMLLRWLEASLAGSIGPRMLRTPAELWPSWLDDVRRFWRSASLLDWTRWYHPCAGSGWQRHGTAISRPWSRSPGSRKGPAHTPRRSASTGRAASCRFERGASCSTRAAGRWRSNGTASGSYGGCHHRWPAMPRTACWTPPKPWRQQPAS